MIAILNTRIIQVNDESNQKDNTHLFVENNLVDQFNNMSINTLTYVKVTVKAVYSAIGDLSQTVKAKLISSLPQKPFDTASLAQVGTDGLINDSSCVCPVHQPF